MSEFVEAANPAEALAELEKIVKEGAERLGLFVAFITPASHLAVISAREQPIIELNELTDEDKIARFDAIYESAREYYDALGTEDYRDDNDHYVYECALEQCLSVDREKTQPLWDHINGIEN